MTLALVAVTAAFAVSSLILCFILQRRLKKVQTALTTEMTSTTTAIEKALDGLRQDLGRLTNAIDAARRESNDAVSTLETQLSGRVDEIAREAAELINNQTEFLRNDLVARLADES